MADKAKAVAHYAALATEADLRARLAMYTGQGAKPRPGCEHAAMPWGGTEALVEYECQPADGGGITEPRCQASISILRVLLNGKWCDAEDCVPPLTLARWTDALFDAQPGCVARAGSRGWFSTPPVPEVRESTWGEFEAAGSAR